MENETSNRLKYLSEFYLEKTLKNMKIQDIYNMVMGINKLSDDYSKQINKFLNCTIYSDYLKSVSQQMITISTIRSGSLKVSCPKSKRLFVLLNKIRERQ